MRRKLTLTVAHTRLVVGKTAKPRKSGGRLARNRGVPVGSILASLVVGTMLTLVNQGDPLFAGHRSLSLTWVIPLNYVIALALVVASTRIDQSGG